MTIGVIIGLYDNTQDTQTKSVSVHIIQEVDDTPSLRTTDGSNLSSLGTTDGPNAPSLVTTDGTNPPSLWTTDRTGTPSFGTTDDSNPPSLGTTDGTNPISLGRSTDGTNPPSLGSTDGTNPPSLGTTDGTNSPSLETTESTNPPILWTTKTARKCLGETILLTCKENKVIAVDDAFYGRKIQERHCGCYGSLLSSSSCSRCKFVDDSPGHNLPYVLFVRTYIWEATSSTVFLKTWGRISVYARHSLVTRTVAQGVRVWSVHASFVAQVDSVRRRYSPRTDALPVKKNLEATYHCEAPAQDGVVTFGGKENGPGQFHALKGLAVSSTDEIFVPDWYNRRIQVFSMKGDHLRSLKTGLFNLHAITTGRDDTLWVVSRSHRRSNDIRQYSKDGSVLARFTCSGDVIHGIAWHELSHRIILITRAEASWFTPSYTLRKSTKTCNIVTFSGGQVRYLKHVTVDKKGNIFITSDRDSRVYKYDKNGNYISSFGSPGTEAGDLSNPYGITVDILGRVLVADQFNSRVEMFTAEGGHIGTLAYLLSPRHVATGGEGQLVVSHGQIFITVWPKY
ncbi:hypothetical protein Bbelb_271860 [Branchiostoma belcheri]|nr:hypothetical protein Bbelb_271860 [Branchiostoma belcheri]